MTATWRDARSIAILGAGREGRAARNWLREHAPRARLTVWAEQAPDAEFVGGMRPDERLLVAPFDTDGLRAHDLLVRSPGVSVYREALLQARGRGIAVTTPTNLWFETHPREHAIAVTGTKGKSTTSALIAHMLGAGGRRVRLAGNIGTPLLDCDDAGVDHWVIELSSYQIADLEHGPDIGVILNLTPEHLDWHRGEENYVHDKLRLADLVAPKGLILNAADPLLAVRFAERPQVTWFGDGRGVHESGGNFFDGERPLAVTMPAALSGRHNRMNVAAALTAVRRAGGDFGAAAGSVADFAGLPHRLQVLGASGGVTWIDDSIASTPVSTVAALESLAGRAVTLLVGGYDRGLDWARHVEAFRRHPPRAVVAMPDSGPAILASLRGSGLECEAGLIEAADLEDAVRRARAIARAGEVVLLSPGAPSFPRFADYRARGEAFAALAGFGSAASARGPAD